jgi:hypothetical protein
MIVLSVFGSVVKDRIIAVEIKHETMRIVLLSISDFNWTV